MTTDCEKIFQPTDTMHRRTLLPLRALFLCAGYTVAIRTNSAALLAAAAELGLIAQTAASGEADLQWEIVAEDAEAVMSSSLPFTAMRIANTIFLDMGPRQWFGCDPETGRGAGFIAVPSSDQQIRQNAIDYLQAITSHVLAAQQNGAGENRRG
jgi:hypothetical protein